MREILFRGKTVGGEWLYGCLVHRTEFYGEPCDDYLILTCGEFHCAFYTSEEVIPATVGQFTGLTDKNGKKIFEGDIVAVKIGGLKRRGVVFYEDAATRFGLAIGAEKNFSFLGKQMARMYEAEVIGNIHDNPELMEV